ncbi:MAG TPA: 4-hydroxythreonine-4-phosphate dehydrogenase PdxA [Burkholderiaceae bacterium]|jgi:4-hydroxythreonine-4-phosphate dehydrogenase|nr:4-hydroxythreonine-4-phosphate dehydrogenase PdxA [Burkholderiaceae bacterium]
MTRRPRIAFLLGDPSGVGPEMGARLLADAAVRDAAELLLIADPVVLAAGQRIAGTALPLTEVNAPDAAVPAGQIAWWRFDSLGGHEPALGESSEAAGRCTMRSLELACEAVQRGAAQAIVFAPFNKHSLRLGGLQQEDELRYLADRFDVPGFVCEFNITGSLWTSRVTSHVPLREVADLIHPEAVREAVFIIDRALKRAGVAAPRIAVSGLNPHAGDGGSIGLEEIEVIEPAVKSLRAEGLDARGPYSPDTVFVAARRGDYDAVVSMYHDQGQIAMKLMGFERGVTLHGGLPVPVTTPASGSAFDIAGKGIARVEGLQAAFELAVKMAATAR